MYINLKFSKHLLKKLYLLQDKFMPLHIFIENFKFLRLFLFELQQKK